MATLVSDALPANSAVIRHHTPPKRIYGTGVIQHVCIILLISSPTDQSSRQRWTHISVVDIYHAVHGLVVASIGFDQF